MPFTPKISIVIPVYNGSNYLKDAIEAAIGQTYPNTEVIVVNDGSTDAGSTEAIARSFGDRIRYFSKPNGGVSTALNFGIRQMTGDYFSWLSHDDLYTPDKLQVQIDALQDIRHREQAIAYSDYSVQFVETGVTQEIKLNLTRPDAFRYQVASDNKLHGCTMLVPKSAFIDLGLFSEDFRAIQDYDMWFRLSSKYSFVHVPRSLVIGRVHCQQVGVRMRGRAREENILFRKQCLRELKAEEIVFATNTHCSIAFLGLAETFMKRDLGPVAIDAIRMSVRSLAQERWRGVGTWLAHLFKTLAVCGAYHCYMALPHHRQRPNT